MGAEEVDAGAACAQQFRHQTDQEQFNNGTVAKELIETTSNELEEHLGGEEVDVGAACGQKFHHQTDQEQFDNGTVAKAAYNATTAQPASEPEAQFGVPMLLYAVSSMDGVSHMFNLPGEPPPTAQNLHRLIVESEAFGTHSRFLLHIQSQEEPLSQTALLPKCAPDGNVFVIPRLENEVTLTSFEECKQWQSSEALCHSVSGLSVKCNFADEGEPHAILESIFVTLSSSYLTLETLVLSECCLGAAGALVLAGALPSL